MVHSVARRCPPPHFRSASAEASDAGVDDTLMIRAMMCARSARWVSIEIALVWLHEPPTSLTPVPIAVRFLCIISYPSSTHETYRVYSYPSDMLHGSTNNTRVKPLNAACDRYTVCGLPRALPFLRLSPERAAHSPLDSCCGLDMMKCMHL